MPKSPATRDRNPKPEPAASLQLRPLAPEQIDQVLAIERGFAAPWTREMFEQEIRQAGTSDSLVATADGQVVGYVLWWYVADEVHIVNVAVHERCRRQGIARRLLEATFERGRNKGMNLATLEVREHNEPAIGLYESLEFRKIAIRRSYYADNGEDAFVMLR